MLSQRSNIKANSTVNPGFIQAKSKNLSAFDLVNARKLTTDDTLAGKGKFLEEKLTKDSMRVLFKKFIPQSDRRVLNYILGCRADNPGRSIFLGYEDLASKFTKNGFECCAKTIQRSVERCIQRNWISIKHHSYSGNEYLVNPIFDALHIRSWLSSFIPSLLKHVVYYSLSLSMLLSFSKELPAETVHANSLSKDIYITVPSVSNYVGKVRVRARETYRTALKTKKEREEMNEKSMEYLQDMKLKSIELTAWGKKNIACFPLDAILFADTKMASATGTIRDRYAMFKGFCIEYCKVNKVWPDFSSVDAFKAKFPEVMELPYYTDRPQDLVQKQDEEAQPFKRPTSDWDPRHAYKAPDISAVDAVVNVHKAAVSERAAGREINEFLKIMIGESEYREHAKKPVDTSAPVGWKKPSVTVPKPEEPEVFIPLDSQEMELINRVLEHSRYLPDTEASHTVLAGIADVVSLGARSKLAHDTQFWDGLRFILTVIEQEQTRYAQLKRDRSNSIDVQAALL